MRQLFRKWFGKDGAPECLAPVADGTDWATIIWGYTREFCEGPWSLKRDHRARKECEQRGLAFGSIRIHRIESHELSLGFLGEKHPNMDRFRVILSQVLVRHGLDVTLSPTEAFLAEEGFDLVVRDGAELSGQSVSGFREGGSFSHRVFCTIGPFGAKAYSREAFDLCLAVAARMGFPPGAKRYVHESTVPIEQVVEYAARWEDPVTGHRYLDVLWHKELVLHRNNPAHAHHRYERNGDLEGEVVALRRQSDGTKAWPKVTINNRPVYSTVVSEPTEPMLCARDNFRQCAVSTCSVKKCGRIATRDIYVARMAMGGFGGESSMGSIYHACDDDEHLRQVRDSKKGIRVSVKPSRQEIW